MLAAFWMSSMLASNKPFAAKQLLAAATIAALLACAFEPLGFDDFVGSVVMVGFMLLIIE